LTDGRHKQESQKEEERVWRLTLGSTLPWSYS